MLEIIPAIDLIDGKCVRLQQGDYQQKKVYDKDPLEMASYFEAQGFRRLHIVDLDGAKGGSPAHLHILEKIASSTSLVIDFGGGIKTAENLEQVWNAGAAIANVGSIAHKNPELFKKWLLEYSGDKILLAADVIEGKIALNAWQESSETPIVDFIQLFIPSGLKQVFCTDVSKDGLLQGTNLALYQMLKTQFPQLTIIASGGIAAIEELYELDNSQIDGVIIGKAIYENKIDMAELSKLARQ